MAAWFPGIASGPALARILLGDVSPTGNLVVSWRRSVGQEHVYYNSLSTGRPPSEIDLTRPATDSREQGRLGYIDEQNSPQFTFWLRTFLRDLSYGTTTISAPHLSAAALDKDLSAGPIALTAEAEVPRSSPSASAPIPCGALHLTRRSRRKLYAFVEETRWMRL